MDRKELKAICKQKNIFMYQIAEQMNISEPTFIRWMRHPVTGDLEKQIINAVNTIITERDSKEGSSND